MYALAPFHSASLEVAVLITGTASTIFADAPVHLVCVLNWRCQADALTERLQESAQTISPGNRGSRKLCVLAKKTGTIENKEL
jgi:hypothetical protein